MVQILIFGDSITWGAWDTNGGWVSRLRKFFEKISKSNPSLYYEIYNLGVSGDTIEDLLKRFESETKQRLAPDEEHVLIIAIGTNDSQFIQSKNDLNVPIETFKYNLQTLINNSRNYFSKIILIGLFPVDEVKTDPIPWNKDKSYKNSNIKEYNESIKEISKKEKIYFIDVLKKFENKDYQILLEDGLHPNSKGHAKMFSIIKSFILKNKIF